MGNVENWNSILNLQLLDGSTNKSMNDEDLSEWVKNKDIDLESHLIPKGVSLAFKDFRIFIEKRKELLTTSIKAIVVEKQK